MEINEERLDTSRFPYTDFTTKWFEASNLPGVKYFLYLRVEWKKGHWQPSIGFKITTGKEAKVHADVVLSIESAGWNHKLVQDFDKDQGFRQGYQGSRICCKLAEFCRPPYMVDGKLIIKCEGILSVERTLNHVADDIQQENEGGFGNFWGENLKYFNINVDGNILQVSISCYRHH